MNNISLTGITGTNGKTSVAYFLYQLLNILGKNSGYIGTLGGIGPNFYEKLINTTPGEKVNFYLLDKFAENNVTDVFIEASSHGLHQDRIKNLNIDCAVLTNIMSDHLDYHKTLEDYIAAKEKLFDFNLNYAVLNADDKYYEKFLNKLSSKNIKTISYGINNAADLVASNIYIGIDGSRFEVKNPLALTRRPPLQKGEIFFVKNIIGYFNIYNLLAAIGVLVAKYNYNLTDIAKACENLSSVPGRMEIVKYNNSPYIIIDYAHNEDSLYNLLSTVRKLTKNKVFLVFGTGGDRDKEKRPKMAKVAEQYADLSIITEDNSRFENLDSIIDDITCGFDNKNKFKIIKNRLDAIKYIIHKSENNDDVIVIAGKGHEDYLDINGEKIYFNEKEIIENIYA